MSLKVSKERKEVVIFTHHHKVVGEMYLMMDSRISDELNVKIREFIPVTNASIYAINGDCLLYTADFVSVNKHAIDIVLALPLPQEISRA
jgi:hypothetical protein